jgi:hypothetical protein
MARAALVLSVALAPFLSSLLAADDRVEIVYVNQKSSTSEQMLEKQLPIKQELIDANGEEVGTKIWQSMMDQLTNSSYGVGVGNKDPSDAMVSVELILTFLDASGAVLGSGERRYDLRIAPGSTELLSVECETDACEQSTWMQAAVAGARFAGDAYAVGEARITIGGSKWFLEDRWESEDRVVLRTFSSGHYTGRGFDGKVFPSGGLDDDASRYYRVARVAFPAGFGEGDTEPDLEWYTLLPGLTVEKGASRKPKLMDFGDAGIVTTGVAGTFELGDFVQIRSVELQKKGMQLVIGAVCRTTSNHRRLRSRVRFVVGKPAMKGPDMAAIERAVSPWLEPVSVADVAQICGPKYGTPVQAWTRDTTDVAIEEALGAPDAEADTTAGRVLVYGQLKLTFVDGKLAGVELKAST